jgi:hypothetical protein
VKEKFILEQAMKPQRRSTPFLNFGARWGWAVDAMTRPPYAQERNLVPIVYRVKEERNILHTIKWKKANWIGHILHRNCLLKHVIEGRIEVTGRGGRRSNYWMILRNKKIWKLKEEALDRNLQRSYF